MFWHPMNQQRDQSTKREQPTNSHDYILYIQIYSGTGHIILPAHPKDIVDQTAHPGFVPKQRAVGRVPDNVLPGSSEEIEKGGQPKQESHL